MKKALITFDNFSFQYYSQAEPTLTAINLTIYEGEKVVIVGPSGSGKSTLAQCINGLIPHNYEGDITGTVTINNKDLKKTSLFDLSFDVGTVLQDTDSQFIGLTVAEDIAFALENDMIPQEKMKEDVEKWAKVVNLDHYLFQKPQNLSGGQKQRVSMAGVLINHSPILLFDEPLANLDPKAGQETMQLIEKIHQKGSATILIIEHRLEDVLCQPVDRIIVMNAGKIVADQTPDELLKTDCLLKQGIREPLYVTALRYSGINMSKIENISTIKKLTAPDLHQKLTGYLAEPIQPTNTIKNQPLLVAKQLNYQYNKKSKLALDNLSLTINQGEMISIIGKNGAGKTTFCKTICGFIKPQQGKIYWKNQSINHLSIKERADKIGYVMQNPNQMLSKKSVKEEIGLGLVLRNIEKEEREKRIEQVLRICDLYPYRNWPVSSLSFGQKKRVTIASILVLEPEMIILDEPTAGQDFNHYTEIMHCLERLHRMGITILMITHDMHLMLEYTQRAIIIDEGKVLADTMSVKILTNQELIEAASLKETSLFTLANQLKVTNPLRFIENFVRYDRKVRC
ncbi:ABC transporter ATP-binding protein [Melissococcus plutonius]|uniref:ABC transporter ATP-binding protein n=1 Tax=Melissococcus plutonius TaxID=33970 RepID=UPI003C30BCFC